MNDCYSVLYQTLKITMYLESPCRAITIRLTFAHSIFSNEEKSDILSYTIIDNYYRWKNIIYLIILIIIHIIILYISNNFIYLKIIKITTVKKVSSNRVKLQNTFNSKNALLNLVAKCVCVWGGGGTSYKQNW